MAAFAAMFSFELDAAGSGLIRLFRAFGPVLQQRPLERGCQSKKNVPAGTFLPVAVTPPSESTSPVSKSPGPAASIIGPTRKSVEVKSPAAPALTCTVTC